MNKLCPVLLPLLLLLSIQLSAQTLYHELAQDTIVEVRRGISQRYFMAGKPMNLAVMKWFMDDEPRAQRQMRNASLVESVSSLGYTYGASFLFAGVLVRDRNRSISNRFIITGLLGAATGLGFQLISNKIKRRAVYYYNRDVRRRLGQ